MPDYPSDDENFSDFDMLYAATEDENDSDGAGSDDYWSEPEGERESSLVPHFLEKMSSAARAPLERHSKITDFFKPACKEEVLSAIDEIPGRPKMSSHMALASKKVKHQQRRLRAKLRQQKSRSKKKQQQIAAGIRSEDGMLLEQKSKPGPVLTLLHRDTAKRGLAVNLAEATHAPPKPRQRTTKLTKRDETGKPLPLRATARTKVNWFIPSLWAPINAAARRCHFSTTGMIADLQKRFYIEGTYNSLSRGTIDEWVDRTASPREWKVGVLEKVATRMGWIAGEGQPSFFAKFPGVPEASAATLRAMRTARVTINASVARIIIVGHIRSKYPDAEELAAILHSRPEAPIGSPPPALSLSTVRRFLRTNLNWRVRRGTQAAHKLPLNWRELCEMMFFRLVFVVQTEKIRHPEQIINGDQTGIVLIPGGDQPTYDEYGAKQVSTFGKEEKRAFTGHISTSAAGELLPIQCIWDGKTEQSLPSISPEHSRRAEAERRGFTFFNNPKSHWSSLPAVKEWVVKVVLPHRTRFITKYSLPDDDSTKIVLILDLWGPHRCEEFRTWVKTTYRWLVLIYIPGGCTGIMQPCDVILQRVIKHHIRQAAGEFFMAEVQRQLDTGTPPQDVRIPTGKPMLRNATVSWVLDAFEFLESRQDLVLKAWSGSRIGLWNLSWDCITSKEAAAALLEKSVSYLARIKGNLDGIAEGNESAEEQENYAADDEDVPLGVVVADVEREADTPEDGHGPVNEVLGNALPLVGRAVTSSGQSRSGYRRSARMRNAPMSYEESDLEDDPIFG